MNLSWEALVFLLQRTDFREPWHGFGFATTVHDSLLNLAEEKAKGDPIKEALLDNLKKNKIRSIDAKWEG